MPPRLPDQRDDVTERARSRDFAGQANDGAVVLVALAVFTDVAEEDDVLGPGHQPERAFARAHPLASPLSDRVNGPRFVDPCELVARHSSDDPPPARAAQ